MSNVTDRRIMAAVGGFQGAALWALFEKWPEDPHSAAFAAGALYFISTSAIVVHLARTGQNARRLLALAAGVGAVFGAVAIWIGWQLPPDGAAFEGDGRRIASWVVGVFLSMYALCPFVQTVQKTGLFSFPYSELYRFSWNNFFVATLGLVYVGVMWAVLTLWALLFGLIGIEFFGDLFSRSEFIFIVTGTGLGYGLAAANENDRVIAALRGITQALFQAVLPILSCVTLAFLATLPLTGLEPLFASSSAASVLLCWLVLGVLLLNAVYLDGSTPAPYTPMIRRLVEAGVFATPILAGLALYALQLRIGQHGLSPSRIFALLFTIVFSLYAMGYAAAVVLRTESWLGNVRRVNIAIAWIWIAIALAVHTPLLDPIGLSVRQQLGRLERGAVDPLEFDYANLRFHLGHLGYEAIATIRKQADLPPAQLKEIEHVLSAPSYFTSHQKKEVPAADRLTRVPEGDPWPSGLRDQLSRRLESNSRAWYCESESSPENQCVIRSVDLDGDGQSEELVFIHTFGTLSVYVFAQTPDSSWELVGTLSNRGHIKKRFQAEIIENFHSGNFKLVPPRYQELEIGDFRLYFTTP